MPRIPDLADRAERHISPDGRLVLDLGLAFDPRDIHESGEQWRPRVYDAASGAVILDLWATNCSCSFRWPVEGGLVLTLHQGVEISVAPDGASWSANRDGGVAHAAGTGARRLDALVDQTPPPPPRFQRLVSGLGDLIVPILLAGAAIGGAWWAWTADPAPDHDGADRSGRTGINGWSVTCSGPYGFQPMRLDENGRLDAPRLAARPLPRLPGEGQRYGDGTIIVVIDGPDATLLPNGDWRKSVHCPARRPVKPEAIRG